MSEREDFPRQCIAIVASHGHIEEPPVRLNRGRRRLDCVPILDVGGGKVSRRRVVIAAGDELLRPAGSTPAASADHDQE